MSAEKSLKFQFILDETSFSRVKRAMDEMIAKAQVLAKTLQNVGTGGMGGGGSVNGGLQPSPWLNQQQTKTQTTGGGAFKQMATEGTANLKTLTESVKTSTNKQIQDISRLTQALGTLNGAYTKVIGGVARQILPSALPNVPYPSGGGTAYHRIIGGTARQVLAPGHSGGSTMAGGAVLAGPGGGGMGPGGPGVPGAAAGGGGWLRQLGPGAMSGQGIAQWAMGGTAGAVAMRSAGYIGSGVMGAVNLGTSFAAMQNNAMASRGQAVRPEWDRQSRADVSTALKGKYFSKQLSRDDQMDLIRSVSSPEENAKDFASGVWNMFTSVGGDLDKLGPGAQGTLEYKRLQEAIGKVGDHAGYYTGAYGRGSQYLEDTRGSRLTTQRILGIGYNQKKGPDGRPLYDNASGEFAAKMHAAGFSDTEYAGSYAQTRSVGGRDFARKYGFQAMSSGAAGFGNVTDALAAAARSANRSGGADVLVRSALGGGIDTTAGLQLAQSIFGFDPRGTVSGTGALKAIQNGFNFGNGGAQDLNQVARIQLGMQSADKLAGGFDGYGRGMNLVSAIGSMPGGTTYAQDALAGRMSFKELAEVASGGSSARSDAYGITSTNAMDQIGGMTHGLFSRYVEQGGTDNISKAMRAMRASGQSEQEFLAGLGTKAKKGDMGARSQLEALGVMASDMMGGDTEGGIGMIQALSGVKDLQSTMLKQGKIPGAGMDKPEQAKREAEAEQIKAAGATAAALMNAGEYIRALTENKDQIKLSKDFGEMSVQIDEVTKKFFTLSGATQEVINKYGGSTTNKILGSPFQSSGQTRATAPGGQGGSASPTSTPPGGSGGGGAGPGE